MKLICFFLVTSFLYVLWAFAPAFREPEIDRKEIKKRDWSVSIVYMDGTVEYIEGVGAIYSVSWAYKAGFTPRNKIRILYAKGGDTQVGNVKEWRVTMDEKEKKILSSYKTDSIIDKIDRQGDND